MGHRHWIIIVLLRYEVLSKVDLCRVSIEFLLLSQLLFYS